MAREDSVYAEVTPVAENDLEILKLILVPYQASIVRHYPERNCALVRLPDLSSLDALQQVPSYTTIMVDPPARKQPSKTVETEGERAGGSVVTAPAGGTGGAVTEILQPHEKNKEEQPSALHLPVTEGLTQRKGVVAVSKEASIAKQDVSPTHGVAVTRGPCYTGKDSVKKRRSLPANDIIYLLGDINIVAPAWCIFLVFYAIATLIGVL